MQSKIQNKEGKVALSGLVGGTFSLTLSAIIVKLIGLFYKLPLATILGDEGMGYFNSAYTVYAFFYLLCTAGVPKAVMILLSRAKAKGYAEEEERIVYLCIKMFFLVGLIFGGMFLLLSAPLSDLIGNKAAVGSMIAIAPSIILVSLSGVIRGFLSANMKLFDIAVSQIIEGVSKLAFGLVFAMTCDRLNMPLKIISAMTILGVTLGSAAGFVYLLVCSKIKIKEYKAGQNANNKENMRLIKSVLSISLPITLSAAIMSLTNLIDLGLIMRSLVKIGYSESQASALYGNYTTLAVPMFNLAISVVAPISVAFLPVFTRCHTSGEILDLKKAEKSAIDLTSLISIPMMIGLVFYSREILSMLFPSSNIEIGSVTLCMISPAILFSSYLLILNTDLEACGRVRAPLISMGIGCIVKICVSYYLICHTTLGISGAPIGSVISYATALLVSIIIYGATTKRRIPLFERGILPFISAFIAIYLSKVLYFRIFDLISPTPSLLISIACAALIYLIISTIFGLVGPKKIGELAYYTKLAE